MTRAAILILFAFSLFGASFQAGVARVKITPELPIWLSGFAARTHPADGVLHDLWAKALAIQDSRGGRVVIVTTDLIGLPRGISDAVAARLQKQYGLDRSSLVLNSSHTHSGPFLRGNLAVMFDFSPEDIQRIDAYSTKLIDDLVTVAGAALGDLKPAQLSYGSGRATFAVNRREPKNGGFVIGVNPDGPTDPQVPVLKVTSPDGKLRAVLFGYACHNTTLTAQFYQVSGDYAGFAQIAFEKAHPGATAMFMELCGADQNANPRGKIELAEQYGKTLSDEIDRVTESGTKPVRPPIRSAFQVIELKFADYDREMLEDRLKNPNPAYVRNAKLLLRAWDDRHPVRRVQYPVQAVQFGKDLTLLALGGEVVVDYSLRAKKEFNAVKEPLIVAGYSNDVMCYIPTKRVLKEGGYEANESMIYYGQPGPFDEDVEDRIFAAIGNVLKRVGR